MIKRCCLAAGVALGVFAMTASAQTSTRTAKSSTDPSSKLGARRVKARAATNALSVLQKRVDVEWDEVTFEDVVEWLRSQGSLNVIPRWNALSVEGVDPESTVTLGNLRNETVGTILGEALASLSEAGNLRYQARGGTLRISTEADFNRKLYVRVYDITDMLVELPNFGQEAPQIDLQNVQSTQTGGQGGGGQSIFTGSSGRGQQTNTAQQDQEAEEKLEKLAEIIQETIAPESWEELGGPGVVKWFNRSLVIRNTIEVHEQIAGEFLIE